MITIINDIVFSECSSSLSTSLVLLIKSLIFSSGFSSALVIEGITSGDLLDYERC